MDPKRIRHTEHIPGQLAKRALLTKMENARPAREMSGGKRTGPGPGGNRRGQLQSPGGVGQARVTLELTAVPTKGTVA